MAVSIMAMVWFNNWREGHSSRTLIKDTQGHSRFSRTLKDTRCNVLVNVLVSVLGANVLGVSLVRQHRVPLSCVESPNKASSMSH